MATTNYLTENSIKAVLAKIAQDIQAKATPDNIDSLIADYLLSHSEDTDLITLIVGIINDNTNSVNLDTILTQYLANYYTKNQVYTKSQVYTKDEINALLASYTPSQPSTVAVTGVTLDHSTLSLTAGGTSQLTATVAPNNATNKAITWSTSDNGVATVNNGLVTAVASGSATITVTTTDGSYTDTCVVTVSAQQAVTNNGTSTYISPLKLNLNGLDKTQFDDSSNALYDDRILFYADNFDENEIDTSLYSLAEHIDYNQHLCLYTPNNVSIGNGNIHIVSQKEDVEYNGATAKFTSGKMETKLHFQHCLVESRIRHDKTTGNWCSAFWTCGYNVDGLQNWSHCGEIDIFEDVGDEKKITFHYANSQDTHVTNITKTIINNDVWNAFIHSDDEQYHIYGCELMEGHVRFYFDHQLFADYNTGANSYSEGYNPYDYWQYFMWEITSWNKDLTGSVTMDVDWIRAWSLEDETIADLIPQAVDFGYIGNKNRIGTNNRVKAGDLIQLVAQYTPSTVPVVADLDIEGHKTFVQNDDTIIDERQGGIRFKALGEGSVTYSDVLGNHVTKTFTAYDNVVPNGEIALENFNYATAPSRYGVYAPKSGENINNSTFNRKDKTLNFGIYSVEPSTTYTFTYVTKCYNSMTKFILLDENYNIIQYDSSWVGDNNRSIVTTSNTHYISINYRVQDKLILDDYTRINKAFREVYMPVFTKESGTSTSIPCTAITTQSAINVEDNGSVTYTLTPSNTTDTVSFVSDDTSILTVDNSGDIIVVATGIAHITITCGSISETVTVTANKTSTPAPTPTTYSLPSDLNTVKYRNVDTLLKDEFPYYALMYDKVNSKYYFFLTNSPITTVAYNESKGCVYTGISTGQMTWMTMITNTSQLPALVDYFEHYSDGRIKNTNTQVISMGKYNLEEKIDANLQAVTDVSDIEFIYANYSITGYYTAS